MKQFRSLTFGIVIIIGATLLSTLAIFASDIIRSPSGGSLLSLVGFSHSQSQCPPDMAFIDDENGGFCMDRYEAAPGKDCPISVPSSKYETEMDIASPTCSPVSNTGKDPWTNVPKHEAELLCARAGKRLPSNGEWYKAAMGTNDLATGDNGCILGELQRTRPEPTAAGRCVSSRGVSDMVGNAWEWVRDTVQDGKLDDLTLPPDGYVAEVNSSGVPTKTASAGDPAFGNDYFFINQTDTRGMFRGGFWSMTDKAGVFSINVTVSPSFTGDAVGFRCAKSAVRTN